MKIDLLNQKETIVLEPAEGYYNVRPHPHIDGAFSVALEDSPAVMFIEASDKHAINLYTIKQSVIFTYADKRGIYMEYVGLSNNNHFTLHVQWKELNVYVPDTRFISSNILEKMDAYMRDHIYANFFLNVIDKGSKCRRAILSWMHNVPIGSSTVMYTVGERYKLIRENNLYHLFHGQKLKMKSIYLEQLTVGMFSE